MLFGSTRNGTRSSLDFTTLLLLPQLLHRLHPHVPMSLIFFLAQVNCDTVMKSTYLPQFNPCGHIYDHPADGADTRAAD
jgi:hypothetical protein